MTETFAEGFEAEEAITTANGMSYKGNKLVVQLAKGSKKTAAEYRDRKDSSRHRDDRRNDRRYPRITPRRDQRDDRRRRRSDSRSESPRRDDKFSRR
mgnify:CR=1 FL=1